MSNEIMQFKVVLDMAIEMTKKDILMVLLSLLNSLNIALCESKNLNKTF